jgi:aminoglycoside phosphotransferase (APT) family kinase protein
MNSARLEIPAALVRRLVRAQFPAWADLRVAPVEPGGWDNRTFRLGDRMSVRLPSAECYVGQEEKEHRWLPRLAPHLPLPIPEPLAMGEPAEGYPWRWSVCRWIEGERATPERIRDLPRFARSLARFLAALQRVDPAGGPPPGPHNFHRGGPLATYDRETRDAIDALRGRIDADAATAMWEEARAATWRGTPVWLHGDVSESNLLVRGGDLGAVLDFGCCGVGDPACDLTIAWTLFSGESRDAFRAALPADGGTWARARGWALWKSLILVAGHTDAPAGASESARRVLADLLGDGGRGA